MTCVGFRGHDPIMGKIPRNSFPNKSPDTRSLSNRMPHPKIWYGSLPRVRLTRAGVYYLAILVVVAAVAVMRQINLMLILAGMLLGPLIYNWRLARRALRTLQIRRLLPQAVCARDLVVVQLEVANLSKRSSVCALRLVDQITSQGPVVSGESREVPLLITFLGPGEKRIVTYEGRLEHRGRYRFGPLMVATQFPFGLIERRSVVPLEDELVVFPRIGRLTRKWYARRREHLEGVPGRTQRESRLSHEFYGVRAWQRGDSLRWIHWRSSARHGKLVVRQFCSPRNRDVAVIVDLYRESASDDGTRKFEEIELAVSFAATVVRQLCREGGTNVLLAIAGHMPWWASAPGSTPFLRVALEQLAMAEVPRRDTFDHMWKKFSQHIAPEAEILFISLRADNWASSQRTPSDLGVREARGLSPGIFRVSGPEISEFFQWT